MLRRSYASRRLSLESLEVRCNPAALVPLADSFMAPAPVDQGGTALTSVTDLIVDPFNSDRSAPDKPADLNAFAGQTVRLRIASANNRGQLLVGVDDVRLAMGTGQNAIEQTGISSHELGHTLGFRHEHTKPASAAPAAGNVNDDGIDDIIVGSTVNGHVKAFDGPSGAEIRSFPAFGGFTGGVSVAAGNNTVNGKITGVAVDPSDPVGSVYSHPDLYNNIGINQSELDSIIDDLAQDVAAATYAGQPMSELGNDWLSGGTGQDSRNAGAPTGKLYLGTDRGVFVGGAGDDLLIGGSTQHAQIGAGLDILIANTGADRLNATIDAQGRLLIGTEGGVWNTAGHGTHVAGTIGAIGNNGAGVADDGLSVLTNSQHQNESRSTTAGGSYSTGYVKVSPDG